MSDTRVKIQSIVENQLPDFIVEDSPLFAEFLKQYYFSQEFPCGTSDIVQKLDKYVKLDEIFKFNSRIFFGFFWGVRIKLWWINRQVV